MSAERSQPFLIQCDTGTAPGKAICHFVRFETVVLDHNDEFKNIGFASINENIDPRATILREVYEIFFRDHPQFLRKTGQ